MPLVAPVSVSQATYEATGLLSLNEAARRVARVIGGPNDLDVLDESEDAIIAALEDLNVAWDWDFLRKTTTVSITSGTRDYALPTDCRSIYHVRLASGISLSPMRERDYRRATASSIEGTPFAYNVFPSTTVEDLDPQHTRQNIRFIPTPAASDTATILYYRRTLTVTQLGYTIDLPRQYQHWVIYQAKAMVLADHGGEFDRAAFWQRKADRQLQLMKWDDQNRLTDEVVGFQTEEYNPIDMSHPYVALHALDGF